MAVGFAILPGVAHASALYPYAYATNQITGLLFTESGHSVSGIPINGAENISDFAQYQGFPGSSNQNIGSINSAVNIAQAYSGPGPEPMATFSPVGAGNFTGARSDAAIGANTGTGSSVSNVAEAYGNLLGNSTGTNTASLNFKFEGSGVPLSLAFNALVNLDATTSGLSSGMRGQTASATVQDVFSVIEQNGAGATLASASFNLFPGTGQQAVTSNTGVGSAPYTLNQAFSFTTPFALTNGDFYTITLQSIASESITPGTPVPEPASLMLLGTGLVGLGLVLKRKNAKKA